jgi:hypothetical protein
MSQSPPKPHAFINGHLESSMNFSIKFNLFMARNSSVIKDNIPNKINKVIESNNHLNVSLEKDSNLHLDTLTNKIDFNEVLDKHVAFKEQYFIVVEKAAKSYENCLNSAVSMIEPEKIFSVSRLDLMLSRPSLNEPSFFLKSIIQSFLNTFDLKFEGLISITNLPYYESNVFI